MAKSENPSIKTLLNISLSSVASNLAVAAGTTQSLVLARLYGKASDVRTRTSKEFGENDTIMGDFRGIDLATQQVYKAAIINFPRDVAPIVLMGLQENDDYEFAFDFWAEPDPRNPKSYKLCFRNLLEDTSKPDPLDSFKSKLPEFSF